MDLFQDSQISLAPLQDKTVAILGYGNQGEPQALNLRDSGIHVIIGSRSEQSEKAQKARSHGFVVKDLVQAASQAQVVMLMLPDEAMGKAYRQFIEPALNPEAYLGFSHGMAVHAGWITPRPEINVFLLAPKAQGRGVRNRYLEGSGVPGLVAVHQDPSGDTVDIALAYGKAIGCSRAGILKTTFAQETVSDLFSEQAILCGGLTQLIKTGFEVLVEAGYAPEVAYFECLYEVKLVADLIQEGGITFMRDKISSTARFGDLSQGEKVIDSHVKESMRQMLDRIQSGAFAEAFTQEVSAGCPMMQERMLQDFYHPIEETGRSLRRADLL